MAGQQNGDSQAASVAADFEQALQDLARGEQTATALENHLTAIESKIEELLASANTSEQPTQQQDAPGSRQAEDKQDSDKKE